MRRDLVAGVTLAAYAVPVSLAYASLAGLPPQAGLYGYLFGCAYALFGSSRQLAVGPTSAISIMVGSVVGEMVAGDPTRAMPVASLAAIMVGVIAVLAWALRLGRVVNFISETVLVGFKAGAACVIASTQLPKLFGISGSAGGFFERLSYLARHLGETQPLALAVGVGAIVLLLGGDRLLPRRPIAAARRRAGDRPGLGHRSRGARGRRRRPHPGRHPRAGPPGRPSTRRRRDRGAGVRVLPARARRGISVARTFAIRHRYRIDPNQELFALGVANLAAGLGRGYPIAGGMSQSAVNDKGGARTPLSLIIAAAAIAAVLLFGTGLFRNLPQPVLAAVVLVAVSGLVDVREFRLLRRASRQEFGLALVAFAGVLLLGVLRGVLVGAVVSLLALLRRAESPPMMVLGRLPGTDHFRSLANNPAAEVTPGVLVFRVDASLLYFNVENVREELLRQLETQTPPARLVVFDLSSVPAVDISGARMLMVLREDLGARGVELVVAQVRRAVRNTLKAVGAEASFGSLSRRLPVAEHVDRYRGASAQRL